MAKELGTVIAERGDALIYGGASVGLMGALARSVHHKGGKVVGIMPDFMVGRGLAYAAANEMIITRDMRERKATMESRADVFLALPGGFGTLEEMLEVITLKQLQRHSKPVLFLNTQGFYDPLRALFDHMREHRFAKSSTDSLYYFASTVAEAFAYIDTYEPPKIELKWFNTASC